MAQPAPVPFVAGQKQRVDTITLTPAVVQPLNHSVQTFTVAGLDPIAHQFLLVGQFAWSSGVQTQTTGIAVITAFCSLANQLTIVFYNPTGAPLTPAAGSYSYIVL